jgi:hypothetical protein
VKRAALAALVLLLPASADAARPVRGTVRTLLRPLGGVTVVVPELARFSVTDSLGRYDLGMLPPGLHSLTLASVGYETARGTITVAADSTAPDADWLMKPLRPDGHGLIAPTPFPGITPVPAQTSLSKRDSALADSLIRLPGPGPIAPLVGLYLTAEELALRPSLAGPLGELLPHIATADSITFDSGGTGAPGFETWKQWSERLAPQAIGDGPTAVLARRALAYTRTRAALAAGPNWIGWQASKTARAALAGSLKDTASGAPGGAFLETLTGRLDVVFVAGNEPSRPAAAKPKKKRRK